MREMSATPDCWAMGMHGWESLGMDGHTHEAGCSGAHVYLQTMGTGLASPACSGPDPRTAR